MAPRGRSGGGQGVKVIVALAAAAGMAFVALVLLAVFLPEVPKPTISDGELGALEAHANPGQPWGEGDEGQKLADRVFNLLTDELELEPARTGVAVGVVKSEPQRVVVVVHVDDRQPLSTWADADKRQLLGFLKMARTWTLAQTDIFSVAVHDGAAYRIVGSEDAEGTWRADVGASVDLRPLEAALASPETTRADIR